ncbi:hypothetical protein SVAN01_01691, partial [Stagonosporopsis vannaccii]
MHATDGHVNMAAWNDTMGWRASFCTGVLLHVRLAEMSSSHLILDTCCSQHQANACVDQWLSRETRHSAVAGTRLSAEAPDYRWWSWKGIISEQAAKRRSSADIGQLIGSVVDEAQQNMTLEAGLAVDGKLVKNIRSRDTCWSWLLGGAGGRGEQAGSYWVQGSETTEHGELHGRSKDKDAASRSKARIALRTRERRSAALIHMLRNSASGPTCASSVEGQVRSAVRASEMGERSWGGLRGRRFLWACHFQNASMRVWSRRMTLQWRRRTGTGGCGCEMCRGRVSCIQRAATQTRDGTVAAEVEGGNAPNRAVGRCPNVCQQRWAGAGARAGALGAGCCWLVLLGRRPGGSSTQAGPLGRAARQQAAGTAVVAARAAAAAAA